MSDSGENSEDWNVTVEVTLGVRAEQELNLEQEQRPSVLHTWT